MTKERWRTLADILSREREKVIRTWFDAQFTQETIEKYNLLGMPTRDFSWLAAHYLKPLHALLVEYLRSGDKHYLFVYLDERQRYLPYSAGPDDRLAFFAETLDREKSVLCERLSLTVDLRTLLDDAWQTIHENLLSRRSKRPLCLLAIGDCLMNEIRVFLNKECWDAGVDIDTRFLYFSAPQKEELSAHNVISFMKSNKVDLIAASFFSFRGLPLYSSLIDKAEKFTEEEIRTCIGGLREFVGKFLSEIRAISETPLLLHTASGLPLRRFRRYLPGMAPLSRKQQLVVDLVNEAVREIAAVTRNTFVIDEAQIAASKGYRKASRRIFPRSVFQGAEFHTSYFGSYIAEHYRDIIVSYQRVHKCKVLLVDFDNTLWEGVMADGPVRQRQEVQRLLKKMKDAGILLVGVSKNDPRNVIWDEMELKPDDFVALKINWNMKAQSIREVAEELNLGIDSFVLIDDNPVERELAKNAFPALQTLDALDGQTWLAVERMLQLPNTSDTEEARQRTEMYKAQRERKGVMMQEHDYPSLMKMLELRVRYGPALKRNLDRLAELVGRTNQFNTTTIRYTKSQLQDMLSSAYHKMYVFELGDKFGDLGVVGVVIIERRDDVAIFDTFIMSCRAMGFGLERLMLRLSLEMEGDASKFIGRFIQTAKNTPAAEIFSANGFRRLSEEEWISDDKHTWPERPDWFRIERM